MGKLKTAGVVVGCVFVGFALGILAVWKHPEILEVEVPPVE